MGRQLILQNPIGTRISLVHLILFAALLPFDRFYSEVVLISLFVHTLIQYKSWSTNRLKDWRILIVPAVFIANILFTIYSAYKSEAISEWMKQLALLIIPFVFFINPAPIKQNRNLILNAFAFSC